MEQIGLAVASALNITSATGIAMVQAGVYVVGTAISVHSARQMAKRQMKGINDLISEQGLETKMQFRSDMPRRLIYGKTKVSGVVAFAGVSGTGNKYLHLVVALGQGELNSITNVFIDETDLSLTQDGSDSSSHARFVAGSGNKYENLVRVKKHLGSDSQSADADLVSEVSEWTTSHRLRGVGYIYIRLEYDQDKLPQIPNISCIVEGRKVYDPRLDSTNGGSGSHRYATSSTWAYSRNPSLCIRDFLINTYGLGALNSEMNDTRFAEMANSCDANVTINSNGDTQKRYTMDGMIPLDQSPVSIMESMLVCCAGSIAYTQGKYELQVGVAIANSRSHTLNETHLRDNVTIQTDGGKNNRINAVRGTFLDEDNFYLSTDFSPYRDSTYESEDGEALYGDVNFQFVKNNIRAQRLAKIMVERNRQSLSLTLPCNLNAFPVSVNDKVTLSLDRDGAFSNETIFNGKEFMVTGWKMTPNGGVDLELVEYADAIYSWNFGNSFGIDIAPNTSLPDPATVQPPTSVTVTETPDINDDGTLLVSAKTTFTSATDAFVGNYEVELQVLLSGSFLTAYTAVVGSNVTRVDYSGLIVGRTYRARVRSVSVLGRRSAYATSSNVTLAGDVTAPSAYSALTASGIGEAVELTFTNPTESDFRGAEFVMRTGTGNPNSGGNATINFSVAGSAGKVMKITRNNLTAGTQQRFWIRSTDFSGNNSAFFPNNADGITATPATGGIDVTNSSGTSIVSGGVAQLGAFGTVNQITSSNSSSLIGNDAIVTAHLSADCVTADEIFVGDLSSISATIGTLQSATSGARLVVETDKIKVFDSSGNERVRIGNLS